MAFADVPRITTFLVKIASRCNLACDYCYMYSHADQGWREQPRFMSGRDRRMLAERIGEYARENEIEQLVVIFHGGEPLLADAKSLSETARWVRECVPARTRADFSLQTNGTLLTDEVLDELESADIGVSLSIDGPRRANDLHRVGHSGSSSFEATLAGLELLEKRPSIYNGLIAVIDPRVSPQELFAFFAPRRPPRLDFLLPDANHNSPPPGRDRDPDLYKDWLLEAFDLWFDSYSHLPVRMFDAVLGAAAGVPSETDAFGFGDVNLLTIETDGSYHDLDVLKITAHGATNLGLTLRSHKIEEAASSPQIAAHRALLSRGGLSATCQKCPEVDACGGGAVAHRYSELGFGNPTVYCEEMLSLLQHARRRVWQAVVEEGPGKEGRKNGAAGRAEPFNFSDWESATTSAPLNVELLRSWAAESRADFDLVLDEVASRTASLRDTVAAVRSFSDAELEQLVVQPAVQSWVAVFKQNLSGLSVTSIDGLPIRPDPYYVTVLLDRLKGGFGQYPRIHQADPWLRLPFGKTILFEEGQETIKECTALVGRSFAIIEAWRPALLGEIRQLSPDVQFIHDPTAHPDKAVSFSDNTTPGALYVGVKVSGKLIDPYLLADSIIHEHRHQKLYLLQREVKLFEVDAPLVKSPWREDPRPPSGLLHAIFVFVCLHEYWSHLAAEGPADVRHRAAGEAEVIRARVEEAFPVMRGTPLTESGVALVGLLDNNFHVGGGRPG